MDHSEAKRLDIPMQTRLQPVTSVNSDKRTAELSWTAGGRVLRYDWWTGDRYWEELSLEAGAVRLERLNGGAPLLNTHSRWDLSDVIGVVESARLEKTEGLASVRFSKRDDVEPYFQDVRDGIIRNVSVGYIVHRYLKIDPPAETNDFPTWRAIDWEPFELSLVPVGADAGAQVRARGADEGASGEAAQVRLFPCEFITTAGAAADSSTRKEHDMTKTVTQGGAPVAEPNTETEEQRQSAEAKRKADQETATRAADAENKRATEVRAMARKAGFDDVFADTLAGDRLVTVEEAGRRIIDAIAAKQNKTPTRSVQGGIHTISAEDDVRREAIQEAILHRAAPDKHKLTDRAREYRGMTLIDMGRDAIERAGGSARGLSRREISVLSLNLDRDLMGRAGMHGTTDFPNILASTVNRTLRAGYEQYPRTFTGWCRPATAPDFRQVARTQLSELTAFQQVNEGGEYKYLSMGDSAEKYSLVKYGGIVAFTWESMINDDLNAFDRLPSMVGAEAAANESDIVYGILSANAALSDAVALFHATHNNLAGAGTAISVASLTTGRAAIRKQTGPKGRTLNLVPDYLVVGPDKEGEANQFTSVQFVAAKSVDINPAFNTTLEVVVEPRVPTTTWYLACTPARVDTIEYAHLEGEESVYTETRQGFEVDGVQVKARQVFAAKAIDFRGMYKNPGA